MASSLYWYKLVFMAELLLSEGLFVYKLKRRSYFPLRLAASLLLSLSAALFCLVLFYNAWYASLMFTALFLITVFCIKFCFNESWINVIFCSILSYTVRHLAFVLYNLIVTAFDLVEAGALGTYLEHAETDYNAFTAIVYGASYYVTYWISYLFCGTKISRYEELNVGNRALLSLAAVILLVEVLFNAVVVYHSAASYDKTYLIMNYLGGFVSCVLILIIQFNLFDKNKLKREMDAVQLLRHQEKEQYAFSKENIEIINVKCHDLKHKIAAFRGRLEESEIRDMENAVMIYDSIVKTGNEVLDVILTEKSLQCGKNGIQLTCTVDDSDLRFISISDLYSLFGNIIDNAVEAVLKAEACKRIICLNIKSNQKLLSVHSENYYTGNIVFVNGLPQTTKKDTHFHGFGMKSVKMIVEKYGGNVLARTEGELFKLDILIPLPKADPTT